MRTNVLEVENLIRNYRKSVIKESEEDIAKAKAAATDKGEEKGSESAFKLQKVNSLESWVNPDVVKQLCLRQSE